MTTAMLTGAPSAQSAAVFRDRFGTDHVLVPGHRDQLKPGWRRMLHDDLPAPTEAELVVEMRGLTDRLTLADRVLATFGGGFDGRDVLAVGCGDIIEPMFLAAWGARRVVGIDRGLTDDDCDSTHLAQTARGYLRNINRLVPPADAITLCTDDIAASQQPDAAFDLVCSWRTLEHLADPRAAFAEMFRVLRPGGLAYHEYNPFFGLDGGHSLVTLDIPWGHVRLDRVDLARYLAQFRPQEEPRALAYFDDCLNRMTLADLDRFAREAGFEILALVPRTRTEDLIAVDADLLADAKRNYPGAVLNDLICRIVRVVLRRPRKS